MAKTSEALNKDRPKLLWPQQLDSESEDTTTALSKQLIQSMPDITEEDANPSIKNSPVQMNYLQGAYSSVPIFTGGQVILPTGLTEKKKKQRMLADTLRQENDDAQKKLIQQHFGLMMGYPAFQPALDKYYFDHINNKMRDVYNAYGTEKAQAILNDPFHPITTSLMHDAANYNSLIDASFNLQDARKQAMEEMSKSGSDRTVTAGTRQMWNMYDNGDLEGLAKMLNVDTKGDPINVLRYLPTASATYKTLDSKFKSYKDSGMLDRDIEDVFNNGVTLDGTPIKNLNGHALVTEVTNKVMDPKRMQGLAQLMAMDGDLTPDASPDFILNYLRLGIPSEVSKKLISLAPPARTNISVGDKAAERQQEDALDRYNMIKARMQTGGKMPELNDTTYKEGKVTNAEIVGNAQKQVDNKMVPVKTLRVTYDKTVDGDVVSQTDEIPLEGNFKDNFQLLNKLFNTNREGTAQFVDPEKIDKAFSSDPDFNNKTIVKTGTYNGKKVIQYSDGTIDYGE